MFSILRFIVFSGKGLLDVLHKFRKVTLFLSIF